MVLWLRRDKPSRVTDANNGAAGLRQELSYLYEKLLFTGRTVCSLIDWRIRGDDLGRGVTGRRGWSLASRSGVDPSFLNSFAYLPRGRMWIVIVVWHHRLLNYQDSGLS